jgi:peptidoglycan hydrolase CwlO-like protein
MYTSDDLANLSEEDKKRKKHSVQMEMIMLESDLKKSRNQKDDLEAEIRKLRYSEEKLRIEMEEKKEQFEKINQVITQGEEDIKRLKKQLNLL